MLTQGKQLLTAMIELLPLQSEAEAIIWLISLFLKLLAVDRSILSLTPEILSVIGHLAEIKSEFPPWRFAASIADVPKTRWIKLIEYRFNTYL
jgi:hypothetical protein